MDVVHLVVVAPADRDVDANVDANGSFGTAAASDVGITFGGTDFSKCACGETSVIGAGC